MAFELILHKEYHAELYVYNTETWEVTVYDLDNGETYDSFRDSFYMTYKNGFIVTSNYYYWLDPAITVVKREVDSLGVITLTRQDEFNEYLGWGYRHARSPTGMRVFAYVETAIPPILPGEEALSTCYLYDLGYKTAEILPITPEVGLEKVNCAWSPLNDVVVVVDGYYSLKIYEVDTWNLIKTVTISSPDNFAGMWYGGCTFNATGSLFVVGGTKLWIYDTDTWEENTSITGVDRDNLSTGFPRMAFSPNGEFFAFSGGYAGDGELKVWNVSTNQWTQIVIEEALHTPGVFDVGFSPDSSLMAVGTYGGNEPYGELWSPLMVYETTNWSIVFIEEWDDSYGGACLCFTGSQACLGNDMNPAHIIHECLTNKLWGIGLEP